MRRADPLNTLLRAAVLLSIAVAIVLAAVYVPYQTCGYEAVFDAGETIELCSDARGWVWELPEIAEIYDRDYATQISIAVGAAFVFFLLNAALRRLL